LDESAGVDNVDILLVFVGYINEDTGIAEEELIFRRPLKERTTGEDTSIFSLTNACFVENEIDWFRWIGICQWFPQCGARPPGGRKRSSRGGGAQEVCREKTTERNLHLAIFSELYLPYIYHPVVITNFITL
jgi:hypothetical protein